MIPNLCKGDKIFLNYQGKLRPYIIANVNDHLVAMHDSDTPLGPPLNAIPIENLNEYDFVYSNEGAIE